MMGTGSELCLDKFYSEKDLKIVDILVGRDFTVRIQTYLDSGALYRQLSFNSRKTSRTNLRAVNARARWCWYLFTL